MFWEEDESDDYGHDDIYGDDPDDKIGFWDERYGFRFSHLSTILNDSWVVNLRTHDTVIPQRDSKNVRFRRYQFSALQDFKILESPESGTLWYDVNTKTYRVI